MIKLKVVKLSNIIKKVKYFLISILIFACLLLFINKFINICKVFKFDLLSIKQSILRNSLAFMDTNYNFKKEIINSKFSFINQQNTANEEISNIVENNQKELGEMIVDSLEESKEIIQELNDDIEVKNIEVLSNNNKKDVFTDEIYNVKFKNESSFIINEDMINKNVVIPESNNIIIYHTHTCESYTPTEANTYVASGNFRTLDLGKSVVRVGEELKKHLSKYNYNVIHDYTYHDYPAYNGSYNRSLITIENVLKKCNGSKMIIDLHRDALGSNSSYAPCVKINDDVVAQLMFVIGTNGGGLKHDNWINNLSFAYKIQKKANEMFPGLFKPIIIRNSRYNQNVSGEASIIEVGATGNTLEQCNLSMKYLAKVLNEIFK